MPYSRPLNNPLAEIYWNEGHRPWSKCIDMAMSHYGFVDLSDHDTPAYCRAGWSGGILANGLNVTHISIGGTP